MEDSIIEEIAEAVHLGWMQEKQRQGFADHVFQFGGAWLTGSLACFHCRLSKNKHHPDMLPYSELAENVKEYDRVTARAVLAHLTSLDYVIMREGEIYASE